ncbi:MAG TPA: hypothetical protein VFG33_34260, partial [Kribbella sp.]|uniref:hypothetical protein n=1 Tax=Kribbella sp. TaxID=1871183 RepID=UPI002D76D8C3
MTYDEHRLTGVVPRSPGDVVRDHTMVWARALSAEKRAVASADHGLRELTIAHYRDALSCYDELGSSRDSARR